MPKTVLQWELRRNNVNSNGGVQFICNIQCKQCAYKNPRTKERCNRTVCIGLPYCWQHMRKKLNLRYTDSVIIPGIKGLFAWDSTTNGEGSRVIFNAGQTVVQYKGQRLSHKRMNKRYDYKSEDKKQFDPTAPYAIGFILNNKQVSNDAASKRTVGALANDMYGTSYEANVEFVTDDDGKTELVAIYDIKTGDEITVSYGEDYWEYSKCPVSSDIDCFTYKLKRTRL